RGLLTDEQEKALVSRLAAEDRVVVWFRDTVITPAAAAPLMEEAGSTPLREPVRAIDLLRRPGVGAGDLFGLGPDAPKEARTQGVLAAVEVELKYEGYVARERERAGRLRKQARVTLEQDLPYERFLTLSHEAREELTRIRPESVAQAARIPGISPADLQNLVLEVRKFRVQGLAT